MMPDRLELVDAHCHLDLYPDPAALARTVNERRVHTIAVTNAPSVFEYSEKLARTSPYLHAAIGLHPELVPTHGHEMSRIWPFLERTRFVGEVGLDYTTSDSSIRAKQRAIFAEILARCASYGDKTITVHSRRASADTIAAIGDRFPGRVILHWFSGSRKELEKALQFGLYMSVNPAMIQSQKGRDLVAAMPRDRVLTESDGPFVSEGRGPANPTSTSLVLRYLSKLWGTSELDASRSILKNLGE
jgi:TatD DNase family protein